MLRNRPRWILVVVTSTLAVAAIGCSSDKAAPCDDDADCFETEECVEEECVVVDNTNDAPLDAGLDTGTDTDGQPSDTAGGDAELDADDTQPLDTSDDDSLDDTGETDAGVADGDIDDDASAEDDVEDRICMRSCTKDEDCHSYETCDQFYCRDEGCASDIECRKRSLHGWSTECQSDDECSSDDQRCVDVDDDAGLCVVEAESASECDGGARLYEHELFDADETITVCASSTGYCNNDLDNPICQREEVVNREQCTEDSHCDQYNNADICQDGVCGCSSDDFCEESLTFGDYDCVDRLG